jgi:hypothetical protein
VLAILLDGRAFESCRLPRLDPTLRRLHDSHALAGSDMHTGPNVDLNLGLAGVGVLLAGECFKVPLAVTVDDVPPLWASLRLLHGVRSIGGQPRRPPPEHGCAATAESAHGT